MKPLQEREKSMYWKCPLDQDDLKRENLETAIRLYESASSPHEEEKWLRIIENTLRAGFVFSHQDLCAEVRGKHKQQHQELLNKFLEKTRQRRSKEISRSDLARELRLICDLQSPGDT